MGVVSLTRTDYIYLGQTLLKGIDTDPQRHAHLVLLPLAPTGWERRQQFRWLEVGLLENVGRETLQTTQHLQHQH